MPLQIEYGGVPEWPKGADCKSVVDDFGGSNPPSSTKIPNTIVFGILLFTDLNTVKSEQQKPNKRSIKTIPPSAGSVKERGRVLFPGGTAFGYRCTDTRPIFILAPIDFSSRLCDNEKNKEKGGLPP